MFPTGYPSVQYKLDLEDAKLRKYHAHNEKYDTFLSTKLTPSVYLTQALRRYSSLRLVTRIFSRNFLMTFPLNCCKIPLKTGI